MVGTGYKRFAWLALGTSVQEARPPRATAWTEVDRGHQRPGVRAALTQAVSLPNQKLGGGRAGSRVGGVALVKAPAQRRGWYGS